VCVCINKFEFILYIYIYISANIRIDTLYLRNIPSPMTSSIDYVSTLLRYRTVKTNVIDHEKRSVSLRELNVQCPFIDQTIHDTSAHSFSG